MKKNLPITDTEFPFPAGDELVSATDPKGVITHANDCFIKVSGFDWDELRGSSHNIVRHPDMPPAAFQNMWDTLKRGQPWMGIVKNRRKNGDYYWVDAFVTPAKDGNSVVGYESVRSQPHADAVKRATALYRNLQKSSVARLLPTPGIVAKVASAFSVAAAIGIAAITIGGELGLGAAMVTWALISLLGGFASRLMLGGLQKAAAGARSITNNPTMQQV